ncbi:MAG: hypothetical protein PHI12_00315 [Dehalococcoidales bacterium]|nr:hypothetical protein [Dehalococcoidales bacterium]
MSRIFSKRRRLTRIILPLLMAVTVFTMIGSAAIVLAGEESLESRLSGYGLTGLSVSLSGNEVIIAYNQPVSEMGSISDQLVKIATILTFVSEELPGVVLARVRQHFDDGQIMEISAIPTDGVAFISSHLSEDDFMDRLEFNPLTRGPLIVIGECEPNRGENCGNCAECGCYPNEQCDPTSAKANAQGCVEISSPPNAHLEGSQYVCNDGYEWNADLSGCVPKLECPSHAFKFQGECYCDPGYEWNSSGTECVPAQGTQPEQPGSGAGSGWLDKFKSMWDSFINWVKSLFS